MFYLIFYKSVWYLIQSLKKLTLEYPAGAPCSHPAEDPKDVTPISSPVTVDTNGPPESPPQDETPEFSVSKQMFPSVTSPGLYIDLHLFKSKMVT